MESKRIIASIDEKTRKPIITFYGEWLGKEVKLIMAHLPRTYRKSKAEMFKQLEEQANTKEDATDFFAMLEEEKQDGRPSERAIRRRRRAAAG